MSNNPSDNQSSLPTSRAAVGTAVAAGPTRRHLLRGGLVAGPLMMTVASRPVMAQTCMTSSASTSMAGSRPNATEVCLSGGTPTYWLGQASANSGYLMASTTTAGGAGQDKDKRAFGDIFANPDPYAKKSLVEVMTMGQSSIDKNGVAAHLVAAVLNAESGRTPATILDVSKARAIWSDYALSGKFVPTAGVEWREPQIIDWLRTTMPLNS